MGDRQGQRTDRLTQNFGEVVTGETAAIAARKAGFGNPETYRQAKTVVSNGTPELVEAIRRAGERRGRPSENSQNIGTLSGRTDDAAS